MDDDKEKQAEPLVPTGAMPASAHEEEENEDMKKQQIPPMQEGLAEKPRSGQKSDFYTSFWPTLLFVVLSFVMVGFLFVIFISMIMIILRIALAEKNYYLAKGFLWGTLVGVGIPFGLLLLMAGTCMIFGGARFG